MKILYVEHDDDNLYMLKTRLERCGDFEVLAAEDSEQGCKLAVTEHPDVILIDLEMPVMDRWEPVRTLKKDPRTRNIPIIGMSAYAETSEREKAIATGCDEFDAKPNLRVSSRLFGACLRSPNRCSDRADRDGAPPGCIC
jgi:CheY-like chemotaxis protein